MLGNELGFHQYFKEDLKTDPNKYRPTSVLPVVSKLIELFLTVKVQLWYC